MPYLQWHDPVCRNSQIIHQKKDKKKKKTEPMNKLGKVARHMINRQKSICMCISIYQKHNMKNKIKGAFQFTIARKNNKILDDKFTKTSGGPPVH